MPNNPVCSICLKPLTKEDAYVKNNSPYCLNDALLEYKQDVTKYANWRMMYYFLLVFIFILWLIIAIISQMNMFSALLFFFIPVFNISCVFLFINNFLSGSATSHILFIKEILQKGFNVADVPAFKRDLRKNSSREAIYFITLLFVFLLVNVLLLNYFFKLPPI